MKTPYKYACSSNLFFENTTQILVLECFYENLYILCCFFGNSTTCWLIFMTKFEMFACLRKHHLWEHFSENHSFTKRPPNCRFSLDFHEKPCFLVDFLAFVPPVGWFSNRFLCRFSEVHDLESLSLDGISSHGFQGSIRFRCQSLSFWTLDFLTWFSLDVVSWKLRPSISSVDFC